MRMINGKIKVLSIHSIITLCILALSLSLSQAADITLTVGDGSGSPGSGDNQVTVSLENQNDKVKGVQMDICDEDDYLTCTECDTTERTSGFSCSTEESEDGCCGVIFFSLGGDSIDKGAGEIFTLTYDVSSEAPSGECKDLNPNEVKVSDENQQPLDVTSESGKFCFVTSSTTTTTISPIVVSPDPLWKSHLIPLPYLMVIEGTGTHFRAFKTTLRFEPPGAIFPFFPLIWGDLYIWDLIWVMPAWFAGAEDQSVTVTVATEDEIDEIVEGDFEIKLLPFILDQQRGK